MTNNQENESTTGLDYYAPEELEAMPVGTEVEDEDLGAIQKLPCGDWIQVEREVPRMSSSCFLVLRQPPGGQLEDETPVRLVKDTAKPSDSTDALIASLNLDPWQERVLEAAFSNGSRPTRFELRPIRKY